MKSDKKLGIIIGLLIIIILFLIFYIVYDKMYFSLDDTDKSKMDDSKNITEKSNEVKICYGTYYGQISGSYPNGLTYDYKYTYVLNSDGTYIADFGGVSGNKGTYKIENGKISFVHVSDTNATEVVDTYDISNDCNTITINISEGLFNLVRN